jgi:hypothetical protein
MFAIAIPTLQYKFTNHELYCVASASLGIPNPVCSPHMGTRLVRTVPEEDQDDADMMRRGGTVDAFGFHVSARPQQGGSWKWRHDKFAQFVALTSDDAAQWCVGPTVTRAQERREPICPALAAAPIILLKYDLSNSS